MLPRAVLRRRRPTTAVTATAAAVATATAAAVALRPTAACSAPPPPQYASDAQAGGHVDGVRFVGSMLHKRLQNEGRGEREAASLAALSQSPRWRRFVPEYGGLREADGAEPWLVMENLAAGMARPAVLDLKVGTRHFSPDAPPKKIAKEKKKAATTTIATHGLRIVGCRIPAGDDGLPKWAEVWGYKLGNDADAGALPGALHRFLGSRQRVDTALSFVRQLREVFATQQEYVFYGSSLLLVYDAALGEQAPLHIKMIDFGHVHPWAPVEVPPAAGQAVAGNDGYLYAAPAAVHLSHARTLSFSQCLSLPCVLQVWAGSLLGDTGGGA